MQTDEATSTEDAIRAALVRNARGIDRCDGADPVDLPCRFDRRARRLQGQWRAGEWKIAERVVVIDWSKTESVEATFPADRFTRGGRWPDDPSYEGRS